MKRAEANLAGLRRLYHHMINGGKWNATTDNERLSLAIALIEEQAAEIDGHKKAIEDAVADATAEYISNL